MSTEKGSFPPPPPGPPPSQAQHQHSNETPLPEPIPQPHRAPTNETDLYGATPPEEKHGFFGAPAAGAPSGQQEPATKSSWSQKLTDWGTKAAVPFNSMVAKVGSETFLPTTMDKECAKAARILKAFCKDGIYNEDAAQAPIATDTPDSKPDSKGSTPPTTKAKGKDKARVLLTIPPKVIARAQGLAIFTNVRAGFHVSGASGSGVLVARLPDGSWSPPSGIQVHSVGAGFVIGLDILDCVVVINTREALQHFTNTRMSFGSDLAVTAGPWGAGGALEWGVPNTSRGRDKAPELPPRPGSSTTPAPAPSADIPATPQFAPPPTAEDTSHLDPKAKPTSRKPSPGGFRDTLSKPVYSYVKSKGFYAGVQIDGTVVNERKDANAAFYGERIPVDKILKGEVPRAGPGGMWPASAQELFSVLRGAETGRGVSATGQERVSVQEGGAGATSGAGVGADAGAGVGTGAGVASATTGLHDLHLGNRDHTAQSTHATNTTPDFYPPPPPPPAGGFPSKAAEAAAESNLSRSDTTARPPPSYTAMAEPSGDLPPAYEEDGQTRPPVDTKGAPPPAS